MFRSCSALILILALAFNTFPRALWAAPLSDSAAAELLKADSEKTWVADQFIANQDRVLEEVFDLTGRLEELTKIRRAELGDGKYNELVLKGDKDSLRVTVDGLGKAEPTTVDGVIITRVVHEKTGIVFLLVNSQVSLESKHLEQLVARQHLEAGEKGRNVMILRTESEAWPEGGRQNEASWIKYLPKPRWTQAQWWREWKRATYVTPTRWDVALAGVCVAAQVGLSCGLSALKMVAEPGAHFDPKPAILSAIFGGVIGTFASTWKNWTNRGKKWQRTLKAATLGASFAYTLQIWVDHGFKSLSIIDPSGLLMHASLIANVTVNRLANDYWTEFSRIRENKGLNRGYLRIKNPITGKDLETRIKRTNFEYQMINLAPFTLKMGDLIHLGVAIPILGTLALGKTVFYASIVYAQYAAVIYAEKIKYEKAPQLRAAWEDFKRFGWVGRAAKACARLLTGRAAPR